MQNIHNLQSTAVIAVVLNFLNYHYEIKSILIQLQSNWKKLWATHNLSTMQQGTILLFDRKILDSTDLGDFLVSIFCTEQNHFGKSWVINKVKNIDTWHSTAAALPLFCFCNHHGIKILSQVRCWGHTNTGKLRNDFEQRTICRRCNKERTLTKKSAWYLYWVEESVHVQQFHFPVMKLTVD